MGSVRQADVTAAVLTPERSRRPVGAHLKALCGPPALSLVREQTHQVSIGHSSEAAVESW